MSKEWQVVADFATGDTGIVLMSLPSHDHLRAANEPKSDAARKSRCWAMVQDLRMRCRAAVSYSGTPPTRVFVRSREPGDEWETIYEEELAEGEAQGKE